MCDGGAHTEECRERIEKLIEADEAKIRQKTGVTISQQVTADRSDGRPSVVPSVEGVRPEDHGELGTSGTSSNEKHDGGGKQFAPTSSSSCSVPDAVNVRLRLREETLR